MKTLIAVGSLLHSLDTNFHPVNYPTLSDRASCFIHSPTRYVLQALRAVPALKAIQNLVTRRVFKRNAIHLHPLGWSLLAEKKIKTYSIIVNNMATPTQCGWVLFNVDGITVGTG